MPHVTLHRSDAVKASAIAQKPILVRHLPPRRRQITPHLTYTPFGLYLRGADLKRAEERQAAEQIKHLAIVVVGRRGRVGVEELAIRASRDLSAGLLSGSTIGKAASILSSWAERKGLMPAATGA